MLKYLLLFAALSTPILGYLLWMWIRRHQPPEHNKRPTSLPWSWLLLCSLVFVMIAFVGLGFVNENT